MTDEYMKIWVRQMDFWFSQKGKELQLCLVAQGHRVFLFEILLFLLGSGFSASDIIKKLEEEIG